MRVLKDPPSGWPALVLNADYRPRTVKLPPLRGGKTWRRAIDTSLSGGNDFLDQGAEVPIDRADAYVASPRSTVVLVGS